ncbi:hypothetical protein BDW59DRAFT_137407 [Aspergillus cavernicola]|uniref:Uncharacterized protein n=1 Tax=Aspergillus cavernicola TaxID=176166 RepID=A0ABR4J6S4_9EURO
MKKRTVLTLLSSSSSSCSSHGAFHLPRGEIEIQSWDECECESESKLGLMSFLKKNKPQVCLCESTNCPSLHSNQPVP